MKYREIKVNLAKNITDDFNAFLEQLHPLGYYEILFDPSLKKAGEIISDYTNIRIYLQEESVADEIRILIFLHSRAANDFFSETRIIETREYMTSYQEYYKPFKAGEKIMVIPIWDKQNQEIVGTSDIPLYINPGLAFGTGHHETTKMMISRLESVVEKNDRILDAGCGSGILSIAAARLGAASITAFDIDPNAVDSSNYNWKENDFGSFPAFQCLEGGFDLPELQNQEFDLAVINITFAVISANIQQIARLKTRKFLFSGVIQEKEEELISLLEKMAGGKAVFRDSLNDWILIQWNRLPLEK